MIAARLNQGGRSFPGTGLPFYPEKSFTPQLRADIIASPPTWFCQDGALIPFQLLHPGGTGIVSNFYIETANGFFTYPLSTASIETVGSTLGNMMVCRGLIETGVSPGIYRFIVVSEAIAVYSDHFQVGELGAECGDVLPLMGIMWYDNKEWLDGIYYNFGDGYKNYMWVRSVFSRPKFDQTIEEIGDGLGYRNNVLTRTEDVHSFDVLAVDSQMLLLSRIAHHDKVFVKAPDSEVWYAVYKMNAVDTGERSDGIAIVEVSFRVGYMESTQVDFPL